MATTTVANAITLRSHAHSVRFEAATNLLQRSPTVRNTLCDLDDATIGSELDVTLASVDESSPVLTLLHEFLLLLNDDASDAFVDYDDYDVKVYDCEREQDIAEANVPQWRARAALTRHFPDSRRDFCRRHFSEFETSASASALRPPILTCTDQQLADAHSFLTLCHFLQINRGTSTLLRWFARDIIKHSDVAQIRAFFRIENEFESGEQYAIEHENALFCDDDGQ